jgi:predicted ATPase
VRAENRLQEALVEAPAIGAVTFELRCATDLAAHLIATGRRPKAARLLAPIYQKFTEGFETRDLVAATQMLHRARTMNSGRN